MYSIRRLLLVFMLLVAIPFQGVASTLMFACEMSHGLTVAVSVHTHDSHIASPDHSHSAQAVQAKFVDPDSLYLAKVSVEGDQHSSSSDLHKNHIKHNTCGSSTSSGAISDAVLFLASPSTNCSEFTYISSLHLPPVLAGLDRPPRLTLA